MTLRAFERRLLTEPGRTRFTAARAAHALRQALRDGESFPAARDRILATSWLSDALRQTHHFGAFRDLSGA